MKATVFLEPKVYVGFLNIFDPAHANSICIYHSLRFNKHFLKKIQ